MISLDEQFINNTTDSEAGFISGLLTEYVNASTVAVQPGTYIAADYQTIIRVDSTLNADVSTTGAGGRQSGKTEQASSWYEVYVIADNNGDNPAAFLREEAQTLSLPSGYSTKRKVGWVRNDSASDFYDYHQHTPERWTWANDGDHEALNTTSPATTNAIISLADYVPPSAKLVFFTIQSTGDGTAGVNSMGIKPARSTVVMLSATGWAGHSAGDNTTRGGPVAMDGNRQIEYNTLNASDGLIRVVGWVDPR